MVLGFFMMCLTMLVFHKKHPLKVEGLFKGLQLFSSAIFSLGHGANDAQKTMGIIAILLYSVAGSNTFISDYLYENTGEFHVPGWLIITCYSVIALGTIIGGKKVIKTLGDGLARLKPVQGFCAETSGALTLMGTAVLGIPVSTTHTITGSIIGVGITKGIAFRSLGHCDEYCCGLDSYNSGNNRDVRFGLLGNGIIFNFTGINSFVKFTRFIKFMKQQN